jgi:hypothetical protein
LKKKIAEAGLEESLKDKVQWCVIDVDEADDIAAE